jgi:hypothetical protein
MYENEYFLVVLLDMTKYPDFLSYSYLRMISSMLYCSAMSPLIADQWVFLLIDDADYFAFSLVRLHQSMSILNVFPVESLLKKNLECPILEIRQIFFKFVT